MPAKRIQLTLVIALFVLFSCNSKKNQTPDLKKAATITTASAEILPDGEFTLSEYASGFNDAVTQKFSISSAKPSVITGKKGLKIIVDPSVLEKENGTAVDGKINVSIIELTNSEDFFKSNAATVSNGKLLMSGGSYFIGMECNGEKLRIKKDKNLQVDFPVLSNAEMELFYGQRDSSENMNWKRAGINLTKTEEDELLFTDSSQNTFDDNLPAFALTETNEAKIFPTLNEKVYYYENPMTIKALVDTVNRYRAKIYIDTVYMWPKQIAKLLPGQRVDTNFLYKAYGPPKQFILKRCAESQEDNKRKAADKLKRDNAIAKWQPKNLAGQIQKYYSPALIRNLGWINCDRFYKYNEQTEIELDLPITFNRGSVQYFIIFKSFSGLINGKLNFTDGKNIPLKNLPADEPVTLIAFTKSNGQVFHCKQEFVIEKNKTVKLDFKNISAGEMSKIFGKNVRI